MNALTMISKICLPEKATAADVTLNGQAACCLLTPNSSRNITKKSPVVRSVMPVRNVIAIQAAPTNPLTWNIGVPQNTCTAL